MPGDSGRCIFSRCAWQGGPRWLNYPAVPVTPTPLFTQTKPQRIERSDERANGLGPSCLLLYPLSCFYISEPHLFNLSNSYTSWFHINDNKISLHKCLGGPGVRTLSFFRRGLHLITVMTLIWKSCFGSFSKFVRLLNARLVYLSSFHFSTRAFHSLRLGNTDKHFKKCMLLGHVIDHQPHNSILPRQVALAPRQAELFNLFLSLSRCTQVTMFKQAESWFKVHNDISCRPSSPPNKKWPQRCRLFKASCYFSQCQCHGGTVTSLLVYCSVRLGPFTAPLFMLR